MAAKASEFMTALSELGTGVVSSAGNVQAWCSSLPYVAPAETAAGEMAEKLEHVGEVLSWVNTFVQGVNAIGQCMDGSHKLAEFQRNPNSKTAEAWATGVGRVFEGFGDTVGATRGSLLRVFGKTLLKAPKAIIGSFISVQNAYYSRIDEATKDNGTGKGKVLQPGTTENDPVNQ